MQPRYNLWLEVDGQVVLSLWRVELLRAVAATGSISAAAEQLGVRIYEDTKATEIHEMEMRLGEKLVETQVGGRHGGGARLTATAERHLARFDRLAEDMERFVADSFDANFPLS